MSNPFKVKAVYSSISLAFALQSAVVLAGGYYPALPPTLSTSVTPNVMLMIDNSGSMVQDQNNAWIAKRSSCDSADEIWTGCLVNNTDGYRTWIDSNSSNPNTKMNIAKRVAKNLVTNNSTLRWGVASFRVNNPDGIGGSERSAGAKIVTTIGSSTSNVISGIDSLVGRTATPLGEALLEITQYYQGKSSLNGLGDYTSPIQYRCQKNFTIVITDGDASNDETFPTINYTSINSSNVAVSKTFNVCTAASGTDCPATLEGATNTNPSFGDTNNRPRALRDVAKYANDLDMRVSTTGAPLNDLDGKSFDDEKFKKQNMQTYTVGFAVLNNVLPAAATVGGGKYYNADNEAQLTTALTSAVNDIVASTSNAGGVATQADFLTSGNKVFQPVFNPNGWYGELRCFNLDATGNFNPTTSQCSPAKAIIPTAANRKIYTSKVVSNATTSFDFNATGLGSMTTAQLNALGTATSDRTNVVNFIRGTEGLTGYRTRSNGLLGDIIDSQPVVISKPAGTTTDSSYSAFQTSNANRNMVFIGANDGMLHAFSVATMSELMGYIPSPVYGNLKALTATDYGQSGGTPHEYHVNGSLRQADVKIGSNWKTILVGGLGQGGKGFFAVDATSESTLGSNSSIKWEWTDVSSNTMGYAFGTPIIYNVRTSDSTAVPAVILSNGYENKWVKGAASQLANTSSLYIVNADTGALLKQIDVPGGAGLSSPAGVDAGQDGVLDYVYAGDMNGKLWRFDLTDSSPSNFKVIGTPIYNAGTTKPIVMRPAVMAVNSTTGEPIGNLVMFGTGKLLTDSDRSDTSQQTFYAVLDKMEDAPSTISESDLQKQEILTTQTASGSNVRAGNYRKMSNNAIDLQSTSNTKLGWYINLPVSTERLVTSPLIFEDKLLFGTGIPLATEKCLPGGKGWIMGVNPLTGSVAKNINKKTPQAYSFIDIKLDGKSTVDDKISFSGGAEYMSGYEKDGIPTELTYVANENKLVTPSDASNSTGTPGAVIAQREANSMAVYTGNPKTTLVGGKKVPAIKIFKPIPRPASTGKGSLYTGTIGNDTVEKTGLLSKSTGVRIETTLWREIK